MTYSRQVTVLNEKDNSKLPSYVRYVDEKNPGGPPRTYRVYCTEQARQDAQKGLVPQQVMRWIIHALRQEGHKLGGPDYLKRWRNEERDESDNGDGMGDGTVTTETAYRNFMKEGRKSISKLAAEKLGIDL